MLLVITGDRVLSLAGQQYIHGQGFFGAYLNYDHGGEAFYDLKGTLPNTPIITEVE